MTEKIARRGIKAPHSYEPDALVETRVEQVMKEAFVVNGEKKIGEIHDHFNKGAAENEYLIIINKGKKVKGVINSSAIVNSPANSNLPIGSLVGNKSFSIVADKSLRTAVEMMLGKGRCALRDFEKRRNCGSTILQRHFIGL